MPPTHSKMHTFYTVFFTVCVALFLSFYFVFVLWLRLFMFRVFNLHFTR